MSSIAANATIAPNTVLGDGAIVGDFCIVGIVPTRVGGATSVEFGPASFGAEALIRSHTVVYAGVVAGLRFQTGHHVLVREACRIGDDVSLGSSSVVEHHVYIGDRVRLHSGCFVPEFTILEDDAWLGPGVILTNAQYPRSEGVKERLCGAIVEKGAKIGAGAVVLPGVRIGKGALVGAGCVVTRDVPKHTVVAGNPARVTRKVWDLLNADGSRAYPGNDTVY